MKVWLLKIEHRYGTNEYVTSSEEIANDILRKYVLEYWGDRQDQSIDIDPNGESTADLLEHYFAANEREFYWVESYEVLDAVPDEDF